VSLECANSRVPLELLELLRGKDVMAGVIDVATNEIETPEQVATRIRAVMRHVEPARLLPCTNCGMVPLPREVARGKLRALGAGAELVRHELAGSRPDRRAPEASEGAPTANKRDLA
jgi:5-methyltetrahydropteroyltriglutamate--homocysteine methyltransferase